MRAALALLVASLGGAIPLLSADARPQERASHWAKATRSPRPLDSGKRDRALYEACGEADGALVRVAAALVRRRAAGEAPPTTHELTEWVRAAGTPYMWPRAWATVGIDADAVKRLQAFRDRRTNLPLRCGIARGATAEGQPVVAAVLAAAPAELTSLPTRARTGQWLSLDAKLRVPADSAKVVLLGPHGPPRRVLTSVHEGIVRSRFSLDRPGRWLVQVLAHAEDGPRPVAEAVVFVDTEPKSAPPPTLKVQAGDSAVDVLADLVDQARASEGIRGLRRDDSLDAAALAHAKAMARAGRVAHDVGDGTPRERARRVGASFSRLGENVAGAKDVAAIHMALWRSPSHRENLLDPAFSRIGLAVVEHRGRLWSAQVFAD